MTYVFEHLQIDQTAAVGAFEALKPLPFYSLLCIGGCPTTYKAFRELYESRHTILRKLTHLAICVNCVRAQGHSCDKRQQLLYCTCAACAHGGCAAFARKAACAATLAPNAKQPALERGNTCANWQHGCKTRAWQRCAILQKCQDRKASMDDRATYSGLWQRKLRNPKVRLRNASLRLH